jgi:hypothetical protein
MRVRTHGHADLDGLVIPEHLHIHDAEKGYEITAVYSSTSGRYECQAVTVRAGAGAAEVTGVSLRSVPVGRLLSEGIRAALHVGLGQQERTARGAARLYRLGILREVAPVDEVMRGLGVSRSTAGRLIRDARLLGLLTVTDRRARRWGG